MLCKLRIFFISLCVCAGMLGTAHAAAPREITVLVDSSLQAPMLHIARDYTRHEGYAVNLWFASTKALISAIRDGADADVVITADEEALSELAQQGQLDVYATKTVASCPLVIAIAAREDDTKRGVAFELMGLTRDRNSPLSLVVVNNPERSEHAMSAQAIANSELLKDRRIALFTVNDAREAYAYMKTHNAAALLLATDVFSDRRLELLQRFPANVVRPASFKAAVLAGNSMTHSRAFVTALGNPRYTKILASFGLSTGAEDAN